MGKFHDSDPSRVWRFGCKPPRPGADVARLIEHQYWLAHRYYNDLVAMSRQKLQETKILTRKYSPQLARLEDKERKLKDDIEAIREKISERNAGTQKRTGTPQERKQIANLKKKQKMLYKAIKERRHALWGEAPPKDPNKSKRKKDDPIRIVRIGGNPDFLLGMEELENKFLNQKKHMRANNGIFWGTYLKVEAAWEQACKDSAKYQAAPDFRHWTGNGVLAVQLQDPGITVDEAVCTSRSATMGESLSSSTSLAGSIGIWTRICRPMPASSGPSWSAGVTAPTTRTIPSTCRITVTISI